MDRDREKSSSQLAVAGGAPVRTAPLAPWPHVDDEQLEAVTAVLKSGKVNYWSGQEGRIFEQEFAEAVGTKHAIAVANGTLALELALYALGIGAGDDVVVAPRTFIATASAVAMRGARPMFADIDPVSGNVTAETIEAALTPRTKAVIVVHLAGWPCDMDPILDLARERRLQVIEDCAQAHGATYKGRPVGSMGHINAFSFCTDKIISTGGEGGLVTTDDPKLWERAWSYKDHGKSWDAVYNRAQPTIFKWVHESLGTNWRLTEMQSALGRVALKHLAASVAKRRRHAAALDAGLADVPGLRLTVPSSEFGHSYYKYYAFVKPQSLAAGWTRDDVVRAIQAEGIFCGSGSCSEIYLEKAFDASDARPAERLPIARQFSDTSLMFQVHPTLAEADMKDICRAARKVLSAATTQSATRGVKAA
jgi:dTDP-4-amino-4,6-dideoxygalactose transaminase